MRRMGVAEYRALREGSFRPKGPRKYRNTPEVYHSPLHGPIKCPSRRQVRLYAELDRRKAAGELRAPWWLPEVPLPLGFDAEGGRRRVMRVDAVAFLAGGGEQWIDAKGLATKEWSLKADLIAERLGIRVIPW